MQLGGLPAVAHRTDQVGPVYSNKHRWCLNKSQVSLASCWHYNEGQCSRKHDFKSFPNFQLSKMVRSDRQEDAQDLVPGREAAQREPQRFSRPFTLIATCCGLDRGASHACVGTLDILLQRIDRAEAWPRKKPGSTLCRNGQ
jgi:hypothetical protein